MVIDSSPMTLEQAHILLKRFDCLKPQTTATSAEREQLQQALQLVASHSDYQMLGVCANTFQEGYQALLTYATALGYTAKFELEPIDGAVYLKFNPKAASCYVNVYLGEHRGVLVSCQSADAEGVNEMYGHLPLDLFIAS